MAWEIVYLKNPKRSMKYETLPGYFDMRGDAETSAAAYQKEHGGTAHVVWAVLKQGPDLSTVHLVQVVDDSKPRTRNADIEPAA